MQYIHALITSFPLNAKFIYEEAFFVTPKGRISFAIYLIG